MEPSGWLHPYCRNDLTLLVLPLLGCTEVVVFQVNHSLLVHPLFERTVVLVFQLQPLTVFRPVSEIREGRVLRGLRTVGAPDV